LIFTEIGGIKRYEKRTNHHDRKPQFRRNLCRFSPKQGRKRALRKDALYLSTAPCAIAKHLDISTSIESLLQRSVSPLISNTYDTGLGSL